MDAFVDLARNGLVASPAVPTELVDAIAADNRGRYFASEDTEVAIWVLDP